MPTVEYLFHLAALLQDRLRVNFDKEKGEIQRFCIQYEACIRNKWYAIVRYDTAHGFAHKDVLHADGASEKQPLPYLNYNLALTFATQDLKQNWRRYRHLFEEEMKNDSR